MCKYSFLLFKGSPKPTAMCKYSAFTGVSSIATAMCKGLSFKGVRPFSFFLSKGPPTATVKLEQWVAIPAC